MLGFGTRLKERRTATGFTHEALAKKLGVSRQTVSNWEKEEHEPTLGQIRTLAEWLKTQPEWLAFNTSLTSGSIASTKSTDNLALVPELDVRAAAGGGQVVDTELEESRWGFPADWLRFELRSRSSSLRIITIEGDSMMAHDGRGIAPGDKVVVDTDRTSPSPPGPFIVWDGFGLVAKRIEVIPNSDPPSIRIMSDNPAYDTYERTLEEVKIVGRIVGRWERL